MPDDITEPSWSAALKKFSNEHISFAWLAGKVRLTFSEVLWKGGFEVVLKKHILQKQLVWLCEDFGQFVINIDEVLINKIDHQAVIPDVFRLFKALYLVDVKWRMAGIIEKEEKKQPILEKLNQSLTATLSTLSIEESQRLFQVAQSMDQALQFLAAVEVLSVFCDTVYLARQHDKYCIVCDDPTWRLAAQKTIKSVLNYNKTRFFPLAIETGYARTFQVTENEKNEILRHPDCFIVLLKKHYKVEKFNGDIKVLDIEEADAEDKRVALISQLRDAEANLQNTHLASP